MTKERTLLIVAFEVSVMLVCGMTVMWYGEYIVVHQMGDVIVWLN